MKIPDINHIALHYQMNHNSNHATADLIHSLFYMCGFVLYEAKPDPEPWIELHYKALQRLYPPPILHKGQILTHLHTASQNSTPTSCGVRCDPEQED